MRAGAVQGGSHSVVGKWCLIGYRVDSIKHATSPSRHDCSRQVVISSEFQIQSIASKHQNRSAASPPRWLSPVITCPLASPSAPIAVGSCEYLLFKASEAYCRCLRNFDTELPYSYCYESRSDNRLESVANAHTAADLHVRPVPLTALVSGAVGVANVVRDTACPISRNGNDSRAVTVELTSHLQKPAAVFALSAKVLNLCGDSNYRAAVTFHAAAQNKFINRLRWSAADRNFRTGARRYADK
jgi:hypothetical protein